LDKVFPLFFHFSKTFFLDEKYCHKFYKQKPHSQSLTEEKERKCFSSAQTPMKPMPKSLRESNRYIAVEIDSQVAVSKNEFESAVLDAIHDLSGKIGLTIADAVVVSDQFEYPRAIIQTTSQGLQLVRASLPLIRKIGEQDASVMSVKTSGHIQKVSVIKCSRSKK